VRLGSLFSGIGGLDLACEAVFGARVAWQVEGVSLQAAKRAALGPIDAASWAKLREYARHGAFNRRVLARHWPHVDRFGDVRTVGTHNLDPVDIICGGFPCQDLSVAGSRAGLDGERSGLYAELYRIVCEMLPRYVVIENVPGLLKYESRLAADFDAAGYGLRWQPLAACNIGAPHRRKRVFVLATRGGVGSVVLDAPKLGDRVGRWPTPTAGDSKSSGSRSLPGSAAHPGASLTDAVRPDRAKPWPTPLANDGGKGGTNTLSRLVETGHARGRHEAAAGGSLNPEWVELLMGLPSGWSEAQRAQRDLFAPKLGALSWPGAHAWPVGRGHDQPDSEPAQLVAPRTVTDRALRLRSLGNGVVPQQAVAALRLLLKDRS
jgi:DNA (cytosine-5)-methyltransferase 1